MSDYIRCHFINDQQEQCAHYFMPLTFEKHCPTHIHAAALQVNKDQYITVLNEQRTICARMSLEELDVHIADIETIIENERAKLLTARATKTDKLNDLDEDARKELRKIKIVISPEGVPEKKVIKAKTSIKKDPIEHLMATLGISREKAVAIMEA